MSPGYGGVDALPLFEWRENSGSILGPASPYGERRYAIRTS
jgi:hypothetical protein